MGNIPIEILITAVGMIGLVLLVIMIIVFASKYQKKKLETLAAALGGQAVVQFLKTPYCMVDLAGIEGRLYMVSGSQYTPPKLRLVVMRSVGFPLLITRENWGSKKLEKLGLVKDVKTGIQDFDDKYQIRSKGETQAISFFQDAAYRKAVEAIFLAKYTHLQFDKEKIIAEMPNYQEKDLEPALLKSLLTQMTQFV